MLRRHRPMRTCRIAASAAGLAAGLLTSGAAHGQDEERSLSALDLPREGYEAPVHNAGPLAISATANARIVYDNNVFAQNLNRTQDTMVTFAPAAKGVLDNGRVAWTTEARGSIYRYFRQTSENHEGYALSSRAVVTGDRVSFGGQFGFERTFESRNDPEARRIFGGGPRLFTVANAELFASIEGNRVGARLELAANRYNFLSPNDDERDYTSYLASLRGTYRLSPLIGLFAVGYANWRDFRLEADHSGVNRDATSTGALLGIKFDPGGKIRGEISAGFVHFDPKMAGLPGYTGPALRGSLIYQPRMRTAITLDAFRGDVATLRQGASGRTETRVRLGLQQEARHNLLMSAGASWRKVDFRGLSSQQQTHWAADGEIEYLFSRHASVAVSASYFNRTVKLSALGNAPGEFIYNGQLRSADAFSRVRVGAEVRFKF